MLQTRTRILLALLLVELVLLAISIPGHPVHIDEAWIGEQAYYMARDGYVHSELFDGFAGNGSLTVVYHRLFVLAGSWSVALFGWSVAGLRVVPLVCGSALVALIAVYVRKVQRRGVDEALLAVVLFLLVPLHFEHLKIYRPEIMTAMFGFASMALMHADRRARRGDLVLLAGLCASLATLAHPYGSSYALAGFVYLLSCRRVKLAVGFAAAVMLPILPVAIEMLVHQDLARAQLSNALTAAKTSFTPLSPLFSLLREHQRLFRNANTIPISALFILATVVWWRNRDTSSGPLLRYAWLLTAFAGALMPDKLDRYAIIVFPFYATAVAGVVGDLVTDRTRTRALRVAAVTMLAVLTGYGLYYQYRNAFGPTQTHAAMNATIARDLPAGATIVAPMTMVFDEIERFDIVATKQATIECGSEMNPECVRAFMRRRDATHVVFSSYGFDAEERLRDSSQRARFATAFTPMHLGKDYEIWMMR